MASSAANRSNTSFATSVARASGRSTLLMTTIGFRPSLSALATTNLVCGSGPSAASTSTSAPSTMCRMRSTSPPKSAWPGVSTMLMRVSCHRIEVALARMVMPRSRSRSLESIARSVTRWFSRKVPDCCRRRSTRVVLPWSTCAMIATLRRFIRWVRKMGTRPEHPAGVLRRNIVRKRPEATGQSSAAPVLCGAGYAVGQIAFQPNERARGTPGSQPARGLVRGWEKRTSIVTTEDRQFPALRARCLRLARASPAWGTRFATTADLGAQGQPNSWHGRAASDRRAEPAMQLGPRAIDATRARARHRAPVTASPTYDAPRRAGTG